VRPFRFTARERACLIAGVSNTPQVATAMAETDLIVMKSPRATAVHEFGGEPWAFLAAIVQSLDDAIFGLTVDGIVISWNKAAEEMYGYTAEEIIGKSVTLLSPPERIGEIDVNLAKLRRNERVSPFQTVRVTKDHRRIDISVWTSLVTNSSGEVTGAAIITRNITEQKRVEEALEFANGIKQQFLDNMNHEIRTPLNGILGMTDFVLDTDLTPDQRENLGLVKISAESLLAAIDDILDFSQLEAGKLKLEYIPFDFRESLGETMKMLGFRAQNKGLELVYEVDPAVPPALFGDPGRLRRIIYNLVGNAVKFTEHGEILLTVSQESRNAENIRLQFSVKDTGIGISQEHRQRIFQPFSQVDGSTSRRYGGTGLGLAIVSRLIELMEGKVWLESEPEKGSTFYFTAAMKVHEEAVSNTAPLQFEALRNLAALIVDNNSVSRRVLRRMLERWGMKATDVADGKAALEALRIAKDIGHAFHVILLDGHMREMDGFSIAEEIKKDPGLVGSTIMMLTSVGHVGDAARCRDLGIAAYLVKPIRLSELVSAICLALEKTASDDDNPLVTRHILRESKGRLVPIPDLTPQ
jgi:two-component system, sensor histidine kinase and response regulator